MVCEGRLCNRRCWTALTPRYRGAGSAGESMARFEISGSQICILGLVGSRRPLRFAYCLSSTRPLPKQTACLPPPPYPPFGLSTQMATSHTTGRSPRPHGGDLRSRCSPSEYSYATSGEEPDRGASSRPYRPTVVRGDAVFPAQRHSATYKSQDMPDLSTLSDVSLLPYPLPRTGGPVDRPMMLGQTSRLPSKFPLPRSRTNGTMASRSDTSRLSAMAWRERPAQGIRSLVQHKLQAEDTAESRAVWTRSKWILLFSVTLVRGESQRARRCFCSVA